MARLGPPCSTSRPGARVLVILVKVVPFFCAHFLGFVALARWQPGWSPGKSADYSLERS